MFTEVFAKYNRGELARDSFIYMLEQCGELVESEQKDVRDGASVWFKFYPSDCLATTINNIINDLDSPINHDFMVDCFETCVRENSLCVFYS